jgi:hypothetical protein
MVRGAYIERATADRMTVKGALVRYLAEVPPTKRPDLRARLCKTAFTGFENILTRRRYSSSDRWLSRHSSLRSPANTVEARSVNQAHYDGIGPYGSPSWDER